MSKAFDKENHQQLSRKHSSYRLSPKYCRLLNSYISHRVNLVQVSGRLSAPFLSTFTVPQGSILGPLLFLIFVNDLASCIKCTQLLFANHVKMFTMVEVCKCLQRDIEPFLVWCLSKSLFLNVLNTKVMHFSRKHEILNFTYMFGSTYIICVEVVRHPEFLWILQLISIIM